MEWEKINSTTERLKVHNGWLVHRTTGEKTKECIIRQNEGDDCKYHAHQYGNVSHTSMSLVVDQNHDWKLEEM